MGRLITNKYKIKRVMFHQRFNIHCHLHGSHNIIYDKNMFLNILRFIGNRSGSVV